MFAPICPFAPIVSSKDVTTSAVLTAMCYAQENVESLIFDSQELEIVGRLVRGAGQGSL
jgi:hypothetical protein